MQIRGVTQLAVDHFNGRVESMMVHFQRHMVTQFHIVTHRTGDRNMVRCIRIDGMVVIHRIDSDRRINLRIQLNMMSFA